MRFHFITTTKRRFSSSMKGLSKLKTRISAILAKKLNMITKYKNRRGIKIVLSILNTANFNEM